MNWSFHVEDDAVNIKLRENKINEGYNFLINIHSIINGNINEINRNNFKSSLNIIIPNDDEIKIDKIENLPEDFCRNIFCEYKFYMDEQKYTTEVFYGKS